MERHITIRPSSEPRRFEVVEIISDSQEEIHDRTYGRFDAAAAKAWTLAKRGGVPLIVSIHPGRPQLVSAPIASGAQS